MTGAVSDNWGVTASYDLDGYLYAGGIAFGNYPTTPGAWQLSRQSTEMGISKFSKDGSQLIYSSYLGGVNFDIPNSLIVNSKNQLVILGTTGSSNFPTTSGTFDSTFNKGTPFNGIYTFSKGSDISITIVSEDGSHLVGSTYVGGKGNDGLFEYNYAYTNYGDPLREEIILDHQDNIYVVSNTRSKDFPVTTGSFGTMYHGGFEDAVVFKMTPDVKQMIWSGYVGGQDMDAGFSIRLDEANRPYICGITLSDDLPVSTSAYKSALTDIDGFVARIAADGTAIERLTYLGTAAKDVCFNLDLSSSGHVVVFGQTASPSYPITSGKYANPGSANFVHSLDDQLSQTVYSTVVGTGKGIDDRIVPTAFLVDTCDQVYIAGWFGGVNFGQNPVTGFPVTQDALKSTTDGSDFYLAVYTPDIEDLLYATYMGGDVSEEHVDGGTSRFDKNGIVYQAVCSGCGGNSDFPTTPNAWSATNNSDNCNLAVFKMDFEQLNFSIDIDAGPELEGCAPLPVHFTNLSSGFDSIRWYFGDGMTETIDNPIHEYKNAGTYQVLFIAYPTSICLEQDSIWLEIQVDPPLQGTQHDLIKCPDAVLELVSPLTDQSAHYIWSTGDTTSLITVKDTGIYTVISSFLNCTREDTFIVTGRQNKVTAESPLINGYHLSCWESQDGTATAEPIDFIEPYTLVWSDGFTGKTRTGLSAGLYTVTLKDAGGCTSVDSILLTQPPPLMLQTEVLTDCSHPNYAQIQLTPAGGIPAYHFELDHADAQTDSVFEVTASGSYRITLIDANNCLYDTTIQIVVPPELDLNLMTTLHNNEVKLGDQVLITAITDIPPFLIDSFFWTGAGLSPCPQCLDRIVSPDSSTNYTLTLYIDSCSIEAVINIRVIIDKGIYFPNAFTPQFDGSNDYFYPQESFGTVDKILELLIFNRWGDLVFRRDNFDPNIPQLGWDGNFQGEAQAPAVFAWYAKVRYIDGDIQLYKGDVTLIR